RTQLPSHSMTPAPVSSTSTLRNGVATNAPNLLRSFSRSIPAFNRKPKKKLSSSAACLETSVRRRGTRETYDSSASEVENRTASKSSPEDFSIECASTPKPKYGCRVQYFKLCREAKPSRAKFEISYCAIPAAFKLPHAASYRSAVNSSSGTKC